MALEYPFEHPAVLLQAVNLPMDTEIDQETLKELGKALMVIAGADDKLTMWERGWLSSYMTAYGASQALLDELDDFDYMNVELDDMLKPLLSGKFAAWSRRSMVQGAIRMSRSDVMATAEYSSIVRAANAAKLSIDVVSEIDLLLRVIDNIDNNYADGLSASQNAGSGRFNELEVTDTWEVDLVTTPKSVPLTPEGSLLVGEQFALAKAVLWVMAADGEISKEERESFIGYMRGWGASQEQIVDLVSFDYTQFSPHKMIAENDSISWGLSLLTRVALRFAGADGLNSQEQDAILSLYVSAGQSEMLYYAIKGLEDTRRIVLDRLNVLFYSA